MPSYQVILRGAVYDHIDTNRGSLIDSAFDIEQGYYPLKNLENFGTKTQVDVCLAGLEDDRVRKLRDPAIKQTDVRIIVQISRKVDQYETAVKDELVELYEQLMQLCEIDNIYSGKKFTWALTEPLKDENEMPYDFDALYESGVWKAVFILHYTHFIG